MALAYGVLAALGHENTQIPKRMVHFHGLPHLGECDFVDGDLAALGHECIPDKDRSPKCEGVHVLGDDGVD